MTWLPLIFVTALNSGGVMAEDTELQPLALPAAPLQAGNMVQEPPIMQAPVNQAPVPQPVDRRFAPLLDRLAQDFPGYSLEQVIVIDASSAQKMYLLKHGNLVQQWTISTATNGLGSEKGSDKTPLGVHRIKEKIGNGADLNTIFKSRQNTGQRATIFHNPGEDAPADYVTTRIMWLDGLEKGVNKGGNVDSNERFIYIHGTPEEGKLGTPASHGCIRMFNQDVIKLFEQVPENTLVYIVNGLGA